MRRLLSIAIALWAGSLCAICFVAAPTLFATLDRHAAGQAAAALFRIETWLGAAFGVIALIALRAEARPPRAAKWLIVATAAAPIASELLLGPMMDRARAAQDMARFGMLHGVAAALFFAACAGSLVLLWSVSRREG
jgi:Domain of unknown function (DUF4149)